MYIAVGECTWINLLCKELVINILCRTADNYNLSLQNNTIKVFPLANLIQIKPKYFERRYPPKTPRMPPITLKTIEETENKLPPHNSGM
jgi:hypothetical protein